MHYTFITPPPPDARDMASTELASLTQVWRDRRAELDEDDALDAFRTRLVREWAIETGLIERLYTWDRGVTEVLISQGIHATIIAHHARVGRAHADHIVDLIADQQQVIEGLYALVTEDRPLTEHDIRAMHQVMTAHQETTEALDAHGQRHHFDLLRGQYKQHPNSPRRPDGTTHAYCPPEHTADEMARLVAWYREAEATDPPIAPEVISAWLHHRFTQIHPFQDGNGRIARALASFVFLKRRLFPLVIRDQDREPYIAALEAADADDLAPLVRLFVERQRAALLAAVAERPAEARGPEQVILSAIRARQRRDAREQKIAPVLGTARLLADHAHVRFKELSLWTHEQLASVSSHYSAKVKKAQESGVMTLPKAPFLAVTGPLFDHPTKGPMYVDWVQFTISTAKLFDLCLLFHQHGRAWQGVLTCSAFTRHTSGRFLNASGRRNIQVMPVAHREKIVVPVPTPSFQFNYAEPPEATERRFRDWLEETITLALATWQQDPGL